MRAVFGLVLVAGVGLAGLAVFKVKERVDAYQHALNNANQGSIPTTPVFVVSERLVYGQQMTEEHVRLVDWPSASLPEGTFSEIGQLFPDDSLAFRSVARIMEVNEPILAVKVSEPGKGVGIQSQLSPGKRAFTIRVDAVTGVSGFLRPGDLVDIYWTGQDARGEELSQLIQQAVRVIAVDQSTNEDQIEASVARTITVEGTPQQVADLTQAQASGRLLLSLRIVTEAGDVIEEEVITTTRDFLDGGKCYISQGFGANKTEVEVDCAE